jgi:hypothetical protein
MSHVSTSRIREIVQHNNMNTRNFQSSYSPKKTKKGGRFHGRPFELGVSPHPTVDEIAVDESKLQDKVMAAERHLREQSLDEPPR